MKLHDLHPPEGSRREKRRIGRGHGSGQGTTAGKGTKGQKARSGGGDPDMNPRLRTAVDNAKAQNMPADNIDKAIKRGTGELEGVSYTRVTYEGYGPGGVALYIECLTDNENRTVAVIRHILSKHGGNLGKDGSVSWMFDPKGQILVDASRHDPERVMLAAIDAGAEDVIEEEGFVRVMTPFTAFQVVQDSLRAAGIEPEEAELAMIPRSSVSVEAGSLARPPVSCPSSSRVLTRLPLCPMAIARRGPWRYVGWAFSQTVEPVVE